MTTTHLSNKSYNWIIAQGQLLGWAERTPFSQINARYSFLAGGCLRYPRPYQKDSRRGKCALWKESLSIGRSKEPLLQGKRKWRRSQNFFSRSRGACPLAKPREIIFSFQSLRHIKSSISLEIFAQRANSVSMVIDRGLQTFWSEKWDIWRQWLLFKGIFSINKFAVKKTVWGIIVLRKEQQPYTLYHQGKKFELKIRVIHPE